MRYVRLVTVFSAIIFTLCLATITNADTTIEWWQFWTDPGIKPTIDSMVAEFEQANPGIKVKVTDLTWANGHEKIALAFASGTAPDVIELGSDWIAQFADAGHLLDMSNHVADKKLKYDGWGMSEYNEGIYGMPWILGTRVLFVNLDLLKRAGYSPDHLPVSLQDFKSTVLAVGQLGKNTYGWGSNTAEKHRLYKKFLPFFWTFGCRILSDDGKYSVIASEDAVDALEFYKELHDQTGYVADQRGIEDAFLDGKIGFILSGDWLFKRIQLEKRKINFTTTVFPGPQKIDRVFPGRSFMGGEFLCISKSSSHPDEAAAFIDYITSPANQIRFCKTNRSANPSSKDAQQDEYFTSDPNLQTFIRQLRLSYHPPVTPYWVEIENELDKLVEAVIFDGADPGNTLYQTGLNIRKLVEK